MAVASEMREKGTMFDLQVAKVGASGNCLMKSMRVIVFAVELKILNEMTKEPHSTGQLKLWVMEIGCGQLEECFQKSLVKLLKDQRNEVVS
jgi:hypothetical protein